MLKKYLLLTLTVIVVLVLAACSMPASSTNITVRTVVVNGAVDSTRLAVEDTPIAAVEATEVPVEATSVEQATGAPTTESSVSQSAVTQPPQGELTSDESAGLLFMREEEKLAHDVYLFLFNQWGVNIFQNIAKSEQTHTDSVKTLLDYYSLSDPAAGKAAGEFTNPTLQGLYDQLTAQGSQSLADAIKVGGAIEEIDILDLQKQTALTTHADIQLVYQNLEKGSRNHLRSFSNTLAKQTGETYQPQYLTSEAYQAIIGTASETGDNGKGSGGNRP
jgi:hypothetical protein